jgi:hypothetical protein
LFNDSLFLLGILVCVLSSSDGAPSKDLDEEVFNSEVIEIATITISGANGFSILVFNIFLSYRVLSNIHML